MSGMHEGSGVTDQTSFRLSEFTWYSRLATWIGAAMLLVQSVLGRDAGPVTILAVLLLGIGFLCFLMGLAVESRLPGTNLLVGPEISDTESQSVTPAPREPLRAEAPSRPMGPQATGATIPQPLDESEGRKKPEQEKSAPVAASSPEVRGPGRRPKVRERAKKADVRTEPRVEKAPEPAPPQEPSIRSTPVHVESVPVGVATELLGPGDVGVGAECPRCGNTLRLGQLAASCPVCGRTHHAVCWMENHFHCGTPDCTGHGSLEAPSTSPDPQ